MSIDAKNYSLNEIAVIQSGYPFRGPVEPIEQGEVLVVQMKDMHKDWGVTWAETTRTNLEGRKDPNWLRLGDVLFVARGSRFFATSINSPPDFAVAGAHLIVLRLQDQNIVLPEFLAWQINQAPVQQQLQTAAEGTSQLSIRISSIGALRIAIPSMKQQLAIVNLAKTVVHERELLVKFIKNRENSMTGIALALNNNNA
jgi:Type I restriction modification DNA specificity domain